MADRLEHEEQIPGQPGPAGSLGEAWRDDKTPTEGGPRILCASDEAPGAEDALEELSDLEQLPPEARELIKRCMAGTEPYGRELKYYESKTFSPTMINAIMLMAAGFKNRQVAKMLGVEQQRLSVVRRHPYGIKLLDCLLSRQGVRVLDLKTKLAEYSESLTDELYKQALLSQDLKTISKITFGMLDRAGYGPTTKVETTDKRTPLESVGHSALSRLAAALEASDRVDSMVMPGRPTALPPVDSVEAEVKPEPEFVVEQTRIQRVG